MGATRTLRYWVLLAAAALWLAGIFAPVWAGEAGRLLHLFFGTVCHQIPERSFHWGAAQLSVCHRCFGVYAGFTAGLLLWPVLPGPARVLEQRSRLVWLFLLPMAVDVLLPNQAWDRVLTGLLAGFPCALFVWIAAEQLGRRRPGPLAEGREPALDNELQANRAEPQRSVP